MIAIQVKPLDEAGAETHTTLFATPNHPFWVEASLTDDGKHWLAAECLTAGMGLQLADGRRAEVSAAAPIRRTQHEGVFFAANAREQREQRGQLLCLKDGELQVAPAGLEASLGAEPLQLGEPYLAPVYNFEVEEFHTYYVGDEGAGVWVHNTGCQVETAIRAATTIAEDIAAIKEESPNCFVAGTLVHTKEGLVPIEQIKVGDWVLSFPDDQPIPQEYRKDPNPPKIYKRVLKTFVTANQAVKEFGILNLSDGSKEKFTVTSNHPIFVLNHGWMSLEAIFAGRKAVGVENHRFKNLLLGGLFKDKGLATVYNLEVEDFHTYYIGEQGVWVHNCDPHSTPQSLKELVDFVGTGEGKIEIFRMNSGSRLKS